MTAFLDTSMVVQYLTGDPPELAVIAAEVIDSVDDLVLTNGVLAEIGWTLTKLYSVTRDVAVDQMVALLRKSNIGTYGITKALAIDALLLCRPSGRVSFPDALLWADAFTARSAVYTLDRRFPENGIEVRGSAS